MMLFSTENKERVAEIQATLNSQMVPGSTLDDQVQQLFGVSIVDALPGWAGFTQQQLEASVTRIQELDTEQRTVQTPESFPDSAQADAQDRRDKFMQNTFNFIDQAVDPQQAKATMIQALQDLIISIQRGVRPEAVSADITIEDVEFVLNFLIGGVPQ